MNIATATLTHTSVSKKTKLKLISLFNKNVSFNKISKDKTEVSSRDYKSVQNVVMEYLGTTDSDIADAIIYMEK